MFSHVMDVFALTTVKLSKFQNQRFKTHIFGVCVGGWKEHTQINHLNEANSIVADCLLREERRRTFSPWRGSLRWAQEWWGGPHRHGHRSKPSSLQLPLIPEEARAEPFNSAWFNPFLNPSLHIYCYLHCVVALFWLCCALGQNSKCIDGWVLMTTHCSRMLYRLRK